MTFTTDPEFMAGLIHQVAVYVDANAAGATRGDHGGIAPDWQPVSGLGAVPCRIDEDAADDFDRELNTGVTASAVVLFGSPIVLDKRNQLRYVDPDSATVRLWYVRGKARNADGMSHHWEVDCVDRYL